MVRFCTKLLIVSNDQKLFLGQISIYCKKNLFYLWIKFPFSGWHYSGKVKLSLKWVNLKTSNNFVPLNFNCSISNGSSRRYIRNLCMLPKYQKYIPIAKKLRQNFYENIIRSWRSMHARYVRGKIKRKKTRKLWQSIIRLFSILISIEFCASNTKDCDFFAMSLSPWNLKQNKFSFWNFQRLILTILRKICNKIGNAKF